MAQIDYEGIKRENIEYSERPKMFEELKNGDYLYTLDIDGNSGHWAKIKNIDVTEGEEEETSWLINPKGETTVYNFKKVSVELEDGDKVDDCYGTQTFVRRGEKVYFTSTRERSMVKEILREKCECQVGHLRVMFNGALATEQYVDPTTIKLC